MKFNHRLLLCAAAPALLFSSALATSIGALLKTQTEFDDYIQTEQAVANGLSEMYSQGLQMGQALRNIVLDPSNQRAYANFMAAKEEYARASSATAALARGTSTETDLRALAPLRDTQAQEQEKVLALVKTDPPAAAKALNTGETPAWRALRGKLLEQLDKGRKVALEAHRATQSRARTMTVIAAALAALALGVAVALCWLLARTVRNELGGDPALVSETLGRISGGDLSHRNAEDGRGVMKDLQRMQARLRELVGEVRASTDSITTASAEIATGNLDLSARTEQTAGSLQETASSMEELTTTVQQSAQSARDASQLAGEAADVAARGGDVVSQVVATMDDISTASRKIGDIIGTIDGIAFQTNILALNAAVEAARAGDHGRGFAVVAGEVRTLAQRSAGAAREIKTLIQMNVGKVEAGTQLVGVAGATMTEIVGSVKRVSDIISEISQAAGEQSIGIGQVGAAVTHIDGLTQQNAALVEESAAAANSLNDQAQRLSRVVGVFRL